MLRLVAFLGALLGLGAAILTAPDWLPSLSGGNSSVVRIGAGLALAGGLLLFALSRRDGAPNRILIPAFLFGATVWLVPMLMNRMPPAPAAPARRAEPAAAPEMAVAAAAPSAPADQQADPLGREVPVRADASGHFFVRGRVEGQWVTFLVDTGATAVALTESDARRVGLRPMASDFVQRVRTANGIAMTAPATLGEVEVGPITVRQVPAIVASSGLNVSLLGMSFLSRLDGYSVRDGVLYLRR